MTDRTHDSAMTSLNHTFTVLAYGQSPYLEECIKSLKRQTVPSRIIMATSTPSPFLTALSERYGIPVVVNERREGIAADWSFAYNAFTSEYVTLAHQDDVYAPQYAEECLASAGRHAGNLIIFTGSSELTDGIPRGCSLNLLVKRALLSSFFCGRECIGSPFLKKSLLSFGNSIACPSVMFHRSKIGPFAFARNLSYNLDWDAWLRLASYEGGFVYVRNNLVTHRIHRDSELVRGTVGRGRGKEDSALFERIWPKPVAAFMAMLYILGHGASRKGGR